MDTIRAGREGRPMSKGVPEGCPGFPGSGKPPDLSRGERPIGICTFCLLGVLSALGDADPLLPEHTAPSIPAPSQGRLAQCTAHIIQQHVCYGLPGARLL